MSSLLGFPMHRVFLVPGAVLFQFDARGVVLFVFLGRIVTPFAFRAFQRNDHAIFFLCHYPNTFVMTPEPTVRPPSRIAKRSP